MLNLGEANDLQNNVILQVNQTDPAGQATVVAPTAAITPQPSTQTNTTPSAQITVPQQQAAVSQEEQDQTRMAFIILVLIMLIIAYALRAFIQPVQAPSMDVGGAIAMSISAMAAFGITSVGKTSKKGAADMPEISASPLALGGGAAAAGQHMPRNASGRASQEGAGSPSPQQGGAAAGAGGGSTPKVDADAKSAIADGAAAVAAGAESCEAILSQCDKLHAAYDLTQEEVALGRALAAARAEKAPASEAAVLWRQGRLANARSWRMAMASGGPDKETAAQKEPRLDVLRKGHAALLRSLELHEACAEAHMWAAVVTAQVSPDLKAQITNAFVIRDHGRRAVELDPNNPRARYILGAWAYTVAGVGWFERRVAAAIFGSGPPTATYEEALEHFNAAENTAPGFWMVNRLKLAQTHHALGHKAEAKQWLQQAMSMEHTPDEDRWGGVERAKLAAKLGL